LELNEPAHKFQGRGGIDKKRIMGTISLEGMEFFAFHGCFREEQVIGTKFIVDLAVEVDTAAAERSDHLRDTLDYSALYLCVKEDMGTKSHLLEHVARRIVDSIRGKFPEVLSVSLKISKINPPLGGKLNQVSFQVFEQTKTFS
jgi:dihydroneopterin aldolase